MLRWWRQLSIRKKGTFLVLIPSIALAVFVFSIVGLDARIQQITGERRALNNLKDELIGLHRSLLQAETGLRGYAATGNPKYLEPYFVALEGLAAKLESLSREVTSAGVPPRTRRVSKEASPCSTIIFSACRQRVLPTRLPIPNA